MKRKITKTAYAKPSAQALFAALNTLINGSIYKYWQLEPHFWQYQNEPKEAHGPWMAGSFQHCF
jgi:hypothetical protein